MGNLEARCPAAQVLIARYMLAGSTAPEQFRVITLNLILDHLDTLEVLDGLDVQLSRRIFICDNERMLMQLQCRKCRLRKAKRQTESLLMKIKKGRTR